MKNLLFTVFLVAATLAANAQTGMFSKYKATYYVSDSGNDSNSGRYPWAPWKTLDKVNTATLIPGTTVALKCGDEFTGTIYVDDWQAKLGATANNRITVTSYGYGNKPKIYGSVPVAGWTQRGSSAIYTKQITSDVGQLFYYGRRMTEARHPNAGYDYNEVVNSTTSFTSNELNAAVNYVGAKWVGRTTPYAMPTHSVTASAGKTLTLNAAPFGALTAVKEGFILVGTLPLLDAPGEWCYNTTTDSLYFWPPAGGAPVDNEARASVFDNGIYSSSGISYVTVSGLEFVQQKKQGIAVHGDGVNVLNNTVRLSGEKGIVLGNATGYLVQGNYVSRCRHMGIDGFTTSSRYIDNKVDSIALFTDLGRTGIGSWYAGSGIYVEGFDNLVQYNRISYTGYNGIHFNYRNVIDKNYVEDVNVTKDDGGGIYTSMPVTNPYYVYGAELSVGAQVTNNIIVRSHGTFNGYTENAYTLGEGIYLDESSGGILVENNTVGWCTSNAYYAHKGNAHTFRNNTAFRNKIGLAIKFAGENLLAENNTFYGFSRDINNTQTEQMIWSIATTSNPAINNNRYINHYKSTDVFMKEITNYSFTGWKGATVHDVASTIDNSTLPAGHSERLIYNDKKRVQTWHANNATAYDLDGIPVTTFTLQPFTSKIVTGINLDCIQLYADATPPTVTAFTVPETGSITVTVTTFTASGAATGYLITESATPPALNQSGWTATAPVSYTATSEGSKTLYAWTRDAAGNVSASVSDNATFTGIPVDLGVTEIYTNVSSTTARRAMPATMTEDGLVKSVTFYHDGGIGNALVGIYADNGSGPSTLLAISASTALNTGASWNTINLITPVAVKSGVKIWMAVCPSIGGLHYNNSLPYRAQSGDISYALPTDFGTYTLATGGYSFRLTYWR